MLNTTIEMQSHTVRSQTYGKPKETAQITEKSISHKSVFKEQKGCQSPLSPWQQRSWIPHAMTAIGWRTPMEGHLLSCHYVVKHYVALTQIQTLTCVPCVAHTCMHKHTHTIIKMKEHTHIHTCAATNASKYEAWQIDCCWVWELQHGK